MAHFVRMKANIPWCALNNTGGASSRMGAMYIIHTSIVTVYLVIFGTHVDAERHTATYCQWLLQYPSR